MLSANSGWNLANFRSGLIRDLRANGYAVLAVAPDDGNRQRLAELGADFRLIGVDSSGSSVLKDVRLVLDYLRVMRAERPQAFLGFTIKPNIYGSIAAGLLGIPVVNNISGLGTAFIKRGPLTAVVTMLYRLALGRSRRVFFQNPDDRDMFLAKGLVRPERTQVIPGSGIDLTRFAPAPTQPRSGDDGLRFLFVGRLLRDKGIGEFVEAATMLRDQWPGTRFQILGFADADNRTAVPSAEIARWRSDGIVEYLGDTRDVRPFLEQADCVVLPSYREGLPRSLLEASAMARPMIATDVPGCREVVTDGDTGFLCEARSAESLAAAMERMLRTSAQDRLGMGKRARARVERDFDEALVTKAYLAVLAR